MPLIVIDGVSYSVNIEELESFLEHCSEFMETDPESLQTMTQIVSDSLVDYADPKTEIEVLRPQLKFLREVGLLFKSVISPTCHREELIREYRD